MTEKQLAANRRNALKSTGPRTARGKARSSRNSVKYGVLTAAPVLPGIESQEAWEEHRDGVLESIAPVGYLEKLLAVQLVSISWRLARVVRYEAGCDFARRCLFGSFLIANGASLDQNADPDNERLGP